MPQEEVATSETGMEEDPWTITFIGNQGVRTYVVTDSSGENRYAHEAQLPAWVQEALGPLVLEVYAARPGIWESTWGSSDKSAKTLAHNREVAERHTLGEQRATPITERAYRRKLREMHGTSLAERSRLVADALTYATRLLDSFQKEIAARSAVAEALANQADTFSARADAAEQRALLNEQQAQAVDEFLSRALEGRITDLERSARRREWTIGTVVALAVGVASILVAHYLVGF